MPEKGHEIESVATPIYDEEAEMSVIGALLVDKDVVGEIINIVGEDDFYRESNKIIFRVVKDLYLTGKPLDVVTVKAEIEKRGELEFAGGTDHLQAAIELVPSTASATHYAGIVKERAILRGLVNSCQKIIDNIRSSKSVDQILEDAQSRIYKLAEKRITKDVVKLEDVISDVWIKIKERKIGMSGIATGFYRLDEIIAGLQPSNLYIVAARPSVGKTSLAIRIAEHVGLKEKIPVLFFTVEMSAELLVQQMLCSHSKVNAHNLRTGVLSNEEILAISVGANRLKEEAKIFLDDSSDLSIFELRARARRYKYEQNIGLIIVDYLQKLSAKPSDSRQVEISIISSQLKALAKELNIPVIALAQLNRAPEGREGKQPFLSDLRESGSIELDADVVILLYREELYNKDTENKNICELTVAKNRTGPVDKIDLVFLKEFTRFENPAFTE